MNLSWKGFGMAVVAATLGWLTLAFAEDTVEPPVLTVRGKTYTASELGGRADASAEELLGPVIMNIRIGIMGAYGEEHDCQVSEEEVKDFCRRQTPTAEELGMPFNFPNLFEETWAGWQGEDEEAREIRACATMQIAEWKIQKAFFDRYGGRVYIDPFGIPMAFDAVRSYLTEREETGDFIIHDEALRALYWKKVHLLPKESLLSEEDGRAAFAGDLAERWKQRLLELPKRLEGKRNAPAVDEEAP